MKSISPILKILNSACKASNLKVLSVCPASSHVTLHHTLAFQFLGHTHTMFQLTHPNGFAYAVSSTQSILPFPFEWLMPMIFQISAQLLPRFNSFC